MCRCVAATVATGATVAPPARTAPRPTPRAAPPATLAEVLKTAQAGQYQAALTAFRALSTEPPAYLDEALNDAVAAQDGGRLWLFLAHARKAAGRADAAADACEIAFEVGARKAAPELLATLHDDTGHAAFTAAWCRLDEPNAPPEATAAIARFPARGGSAPPRHPALAPWRRYLARRRGEPAPGGTPFDTLDADGCAAQLETTLAAHDWPSALLLLQRALDLTYGEREHAALATLAGDLALRRVDDPALAEELFFLALLALLGGPRAIALATAGEPRPGFDAVVRAVDGLVAARLQTGRVYGAISAYRDVIARLPRDYLRLRRAFAEAMAALYRERLQDEPAAQFALRRPGKNTPALP